MICEDENLGKYVYCSQHLTVHSSGWCTVSNKDKFGLEAETEEEAFEEAKVKGYVHSDGEGVLFHPVMRNGEYTLVRAEEQR